MLIEDRLLKYCCRIKIGDRIRYDLSELLHSKLNWHYVLRESANQAIPCLVYNNLSPFKDKIPEKIWIAFQEIYYLNISRNIKIYQEANALLSSFNKEGIKTIPLKGLFLAEKVYNNIALRGMADIDLLIKKEDLSRIDNVLGGLGYTTPMDKRLISLAMKRSYLNSADYFKPDGNAPHLHIHWHIVNVPLPTYLYTRRIKMERFWECAKLANVADAETLQLAPHHLIIYLAEHAVKHSFDRLIVLTDLNESIKKYREDINWEDLIEEARGLGMERQLYYGLYSINHFLDADISQDVISQLRPKKMGLLEGRFFRSISNNARDTKLSYFVYLSIVKGSLNKARFIFRTLFPPPSALALAFNIDRPRVTAKDYLQFLREQLSHLKDCIF